MNDTPRTDAILALQPNNGFGLDKGQCICQWYDHASQLERELSTAQAQIAVANKALALENEISAFISDSTISFKEWLKRNAALLQARDEELAEKDAQIAALHERLEDNFCFNDKGERIAVESGSIPDGISCRDETIRLLDKKIAALEAKRREDVRKCEEIMAQWFALKLDKQDTKGFSPIRAAFPEDFK